MPAIHYLSEIDMLKAKRALLPIIKDMNERELRMALLYVLHGMEIYEAIDSALSTADGGCGERENEIGNYEEGSSCHLGMWWRSDQYRQFPGGRRGKWGEIKPDLY